MSDSVVLKTEKFAQMGFKTLLLTHRTISLTGHSRQRKETECLSHKKKIVFRNPVAKQILVKITDGIAA